MSLKHTKTLVIIILLLVLAVHAHGQVASGRITVYSTPSGALACVDSTNCDTTPATFSVEGNSWHTVVVTANGYLQWSNPVYVVSDQTSLVNAALDQNPSTTGIQVFVTPGGGTVCLDYNQCIPNVGTPSGTGSTQFTGMGAGYHVITVTGTDGYEDYSAPVSVNMGSFTTTSINLLPLGTTPTTTSVPVFPSSGTVRVYVDRVGSTVCMDNANCRENVGGSPGPGTGTTLYNGVDPAFVHTITVTADGFMPYSTRVSVSKDLESTVDVHLVPLASLTTVPTPTPFPTTHLTTPATPFPTATIPTPLSTVAGLDVFPILGAIGVLGVILFFRKDR
jgi:hypothetical protein